MTRQPASEPVSGAEPISSGRRRLWLLVACYLSLVVLGWIDFVTGYELGFFVFYSAPVGLAAWYLGRWPGVSVALGATAAWYLADSLTGQRYSSRFYFWWNSWVHFAAFVINAIAIARIKAELDRRHRIDAQLDAARAALRHVAALLPGCPGCGRPRPRPETLRPDLDLLRAELKDALCPDCREPNPADPSQRDAHAAPPCESGPVEE
jgi:hypothetical protein